MTSLNKMVARLAGLHDTTDVTEWENTFIASILERTRDGKDTTSLSDKQVEVVERIFNKHFAD